MLNIEQSDDLEAALEQVRAGDVDAAVEQQGSTVVVHFSAADPARAGTVQFTMREIVNGANLAASPTPARFTLDSVQVEDESLQPIQYLTPGLLGWAIATGAMFGAALTLVTWRQKKVLRRLRLSPVPTPIVSATPVFTLLLGFFYFGRETITWRTVATIGLIVPGVILVALSGRH